MKTLIFSILFSSVMTLQGLAQKYAIVDTQYILENMEAYQSAQEELNRFSEQWQTEIEDRYAAIERLYKSYQAEKVLLTEEMRAKREEEIVRKENEARDLQRQRFGVEGDLFKKRQELIEPVQTEIYNAIKSVAESSGYMVIFDKAGQSNVLYTDPRYDKSDRVLSKLGIRPGSGNDRDDDDDDSGTSPSSTSPDRSTPAGGGSRPGGATDRR